VSRIAKEVLQNAILFCCGEEHNVVIRGVLTARWQRNLFGEIEIESCAFEPRPASQTVTCRVSNHACPIDAADVRYQKGLLPPDHVRHECCYRLTSRSAPCCAREIILQAIADGSGGG